MTRPYCPVCTFPVLHPTRTPVVCDPHRAALQAERDLAGRVWRDAESRQADTRERQAQARLALNHR